MKKWSFFIFLISSLSFADTYVKTSPSSSGNQGSSQSQATSEFNSMRSVPTVNAQGVKPILRSLSLDSAMNQQIKAAQNANPNQAILIDARSQKVVGTLPLSQQKDSPTKLSRFQTHKKQSSVQPVSPKVSITPYQMQEETIILQ